MNTELAFFYTDEINKSDIVNIKIKSTSFIARSIINFRVNEEDYFFGITRDYLFANGYKPLDGIVDYTNVVELEPDDML